MTVTRADLLSKASSVFDSLLSRLRRVVAATPAALSNLRSWTTIAALYPFYLLGAAAGALLHFVFRGWHAAALGFGDLTGDDDKQTLTLTASLLGCAVIVAAVVVFG